ncbi:MAG: M1 family aminopeptidase [candidate division KSB1 bacterium]|nr:M1 family aminopeptidase [candidate division KSB1 bacterium]
MKVGSVILALVQLAIASAAVPDPQNLEQTVRQQMSIRDRFVRAAEAKRIEARTRLGVGQWDDFDVSYYRIELSVDFANRAISGSAQVGLRVLQDELSKIGLDFVTRRMQVDGVGMAATSFAIRGDSLYLELDRPYHRGDTLRVQIRYHGSPSAPDGFPVLFFGKVAGYPAVFSDNEPYYARCWFPCRDYPGDKADSVDLVVRVPKPLVVASNGLLRAVLDHGDGTWTYCWHESYPISTYLISMQVAAYRTIEDLYRSRDGDSVKVIHFVYPESYAAALQDLSATVRMMEFCAQAWGEYPFVREKYGHAQYQGAWGGMENQTLTSLASGLITGQRQADMVVLHELSHQWWGDWVSPADFGHVWLNEGFATFAEALWFEHLYGEEGYQIYKRLTMQSALNQREPIFRYPGSPVIVGVVYDKGACVLHMLRAMLGDSVFFEALRDYGARFAYGNATTEQFEEVCEQHAGIDLSWFFRQWIYEPGHPVLRWFWTSSPLGDDRYRVSGFVDQIQTEGPAAYRLPLEVRITTLEDTITTTLWLDQRNESFILEVQGEPTGVQLDPHGDLLIETQEINAPIFRLVDWRAQELIGDGNGDWDPGETLALSARVANEGVSAPEVVLRISTDREDIVAESAEARFAGLNHLDTLDTGDQVFRLRARGDAQPGLVLLRLEVSSGSAHQEFPIAVGLGKPQILFVDDDGGSRTEEYYRKALERRLVYVRSWEVERQGLPSEAIADYPIVIWSTGHASEGTLGREEQELLRAHLARGGGVLVAGDDIGYDLVRAGDQDDSLFYAQVLKAQLVMDTEPTRRLIGVPNDPIGNRLFVYFEGPFGSPEVAAPDAIQPIPPATGFLLYMGTSGLYAGIRWYDPTTGGRLVYLTFGLESVRGPYEDTAAELLQRCLNWLRNPTGVVLERAYTSPARFALYPNRPNPFNPGTTISFELERSERVEVAVFNLLGQKVRTLVQGRLDVGLHTLSWDGRDERGIDLPSGVYFVELRTDGGRVARTKAVKLR